MSFMFKRLVQFDTTSKHSVFLFGPRGTGKTTWLKKIFPDALYFDLLDDATYSDLLAYPNHLWDEIPDDYDGWVIIDEIQKTPKLLDEVHRLIEHRNLRFILTGSSARKLRSKGVNLLAGRALIRHCHPMIIQELEGEFNFQHALQFGLLPLVINHESPIEYLKAYIATYLREEVLQEGLTRNISLFSRFLEVASFSQGQAINYTAIAKQANVNRHTVSNFFDILDDLLIAFRLPVFTKRAKRETVAHAKFYYFDVGVYRALRPAGPLDSSSELDGPALETLFLQHLRAINDYYNYHYQLFYWQTRSQLEVDFVLYGEKGLIAFEIKRTNNPTGKDFNGLIAFGEDYSVAKRYMIYGGDKAYEKKGIKVIPFIKALKQLDTILENTE